MKQIIVDRTDLLVSRLSFGTGSLHHLYRRRNRVALLHAALDAGFTHYDTSPFYGFGLAEKDLGIAFSKHRNRVTLATKVGLYAPGGPPHAWNVWFRKGAGKVLPQLNAPRVSWDVSFAEASLTQSLQRCKTDYFDLLLLHEPSWHAGDSELLLRWLEREQTKGRIRYWGLGGVRSAVQPWTEQLHPLAKVIQTKDSLSKSEANFMLELGRPLQFTYGYLSSDGSAQSSADILRRAILRNQTGSVIVSTRRMSHIAEIVSALAQ